MISLSFAPFLFDLGKNGLHLETFIKKRFSAISSTSCKITFNSIFLKMQYFLVLLQKQFWWSYRRPSSFPWGDFAVTLSPWFPMSRCSRFISMQYSFYLYDRVQEYDNTILIFKFCSFGSLKLMALLFLY